MIVVFAEKLPPSVRGKMKLWFIEPTPNVFVSSVSDALAESVADRLFDSCPSDSSMLVVRSKRSAPGYELMQKIRGNQSTLMSLTGLPLVKTAVVKAEGENAMSKRDRADTFKTT